MLEPGWKTYWRVPGEAGVPPQIKVTGDNVESFDILSPLPMRITDESGEAIGYHDEVVFLLSVKAKDITQPVSAAISAFFGVCQNICKPAKFDGTLELKPEPNSADPVLAAWQDKLPKTATFVGHAQQKDSELVLTLETPVSDIFVEGPDSLYFRKPSFQANKAVLKIDGLQKGETLKGKELRCTATMQGKGLEQTITVS